LNTENAAEDVSKDGPEDGTEDGPEEVDISAPSPILSSIRIYGREVVSPGSTLTSSSGQTMWHSPAAGGGGFIILVNLTFLLRVWFDLGCREAITNLHMYVLLCFSADRKGRSVPTSAEVPT
jgi:hypothetical protein